MKTTKLMMIAVLVVAVAIAGSVLAGQNNSGDRDPSMENTTPGMESTLPGVDAGRGPSFSDPRVEPSPWGGRESPYPPYHQDTH